MDREDVKMLVKKWWDIYDDDSVSCNTQLAANVGIYGQDISEKEKTSLHPAAMVTGVLKAPAS